MCSYIYMYINGVAKSVLLHLYLWHDFYNMDFQTKHKICITSVSTPTPFRMKISGCAPVSPTACMPSPFWVYRTIVGSPFFSFYCNWMRTFECGCLEILKTVPPSMILSRKLYFSTWLVSSFILIKRLMALMLVPKINITTWVHREELRGYECRVTLTVSSTPCVQIPTGIEKKRKGKKRKEKKRKEKKRKGKKRKEKKRKEKKRKEKNSALKKRLKQDEQNENSVSYYHAI